MSMGHTWMTLPGSSYSTQGSQTSLLVLWVCAN